VGRSGWMRRRAPLLLEAAGRRSRPPLPIVGSHGTFTG
jgi:hypothetical protein